MPRDVQLLRAVVVVERRHRIKSGETHGRRGRPRGGEARQRGGQHQVLHGHRVARTVAGGQRAIRPSPRDGERSAGHGNGGVRHPRHARQHTGASVTRSGTHRVQPQRGHVPGVLPKSDDFEKLRRSAEHDRRGEGGGDQRLLRRDLGPRRRREGPREHAARPRQLTGAPGERADQRARPRQGYAAREPGTPVRVRDGPSHRRGADRDAPDSRPAQRGAHHHVPGRPGPRVPRGRQLGVHRR